MIATSGCAAQSSPSPQRRQHRQQQRQRALAFRQLLDPTNLLPGHKEADIYSLRHLCLQGDGFPDGAEGSGAPQARSDGWVRAQAWRVLLGYLGADKTEWSSTLRKRRAEYYQFVSDILPDEPGSRQDCDRERQSTGDIETSEQDALLGQIYRDLARSRKNALAFYRQSIPPSATCPLTPLPKSLEEGSLPHSWIPRISKRHNLLRRLKSMGHTFAEDMQTNESFDNTLSGSRGSIADHSMIPEDQAIASNTTVRVPPCKAPTAPISDTHGSINSSVDLLSVASFEASNETRDFHDVRWHSLLRILYLYATLNPSVGYVQGMNEILFVLLYTMGTARNTPVEGAHIERASDGTSAIPNASELPSSSSTDSMYRGAEASDNAAIHDEICTDGSPHAEADAFWCFSALLGEIFELYDFSQIDATTSGLQISNDRFSKTDLTSVKPSKSCEGMAKALRRLSLRLCWVDEELWKALRHESLDPILPYYSLRWLACLLSTELSLPSLLQVWDAILSESGQAKEANDDGCTPKVEFLIDICCALLNSIRAPLLCALENSESTEYPESGAAFIRAMDVLQNSVDNDVGAMMEVAIVIRQRRLAASLTGDGPPKDFEDEILSASKRSVVSTLRDWGASSSPSPRKTSWFSTVPRSVSTSSEKGDCTSSPSSRLQQYAEAFNDSDAAAAFNRTTSNWQARALAAWKSTADADLASPKQRADGMLATVKNVVESTRKVSLSSSVSERSYDERRQGARNLSEKMLARESLDGPHPALRQSRTGPPPNLPIPSFQDSTSESGRDCISSPLTTHPEQGSDNTSHQSHTSPAERQTSPQLNVASAFGRFAHLPSLANATSYSKAASYSSPMPKPLLLQRSAGPPRESPLSERLKQAEPMSRKISTGPLAAGAATTASSVTSSVSPTTFSDSEQRRSSIDSSETASMRSTSGAADVPIANERSRQGHSALTDAETNGLLHTGGSATSYGSEQVLTMSKSAVEEEEEEDGKSALATASPLPKTYLPLRKGKSRDQPAKDASMQKESIEQFNYQSARRITSGGGMVLSSATLQEKTKQAESSSSVSPRQQHLSTHSRLQPSAKGKEVNTHLPTIDVGPRLFEPSAMPHMAFGDVPSSSDVPLTQKTSLQRKPRRKPSDATSLGGTISLDTMRGSVPDVYPPSKDYSSHRERSSSNGGGGPRQLPLSISLTDVGADGAAAQVSVGETTRVTGRAKYGSGGNYI